MDIGLALDWWMKAAAQDIGRPVRRRPGLHHGRRHQGRSRRSGEVVLAAARQGHQDAREILLRLNGDPT